MKKLFMILTSVSLLAQSSFAAAETAFSEVKYILSSKQIHCDDNKTVTLTTSYSYNNSNSMQDTLTITNDNDKNVSVFKRPQDHRQLADDQKAIQQKLDTASSVVSIVIFGAGLNIITTSLVEHFIIKGLSYPEFYERILVALGKNKPGYKANLGQILSKKEITFWGLAPLSLGVVYVDSSIYENYLDAKSNQYSDKLCRGDYSIFLNDNWNN